ncbi:hypothetical protein CLV60_110159 [Dyadobacter jiangsuensis]|uniref:Uncharacterized protein n=1 Tax=Dyadobacter jiangsuensis TaxID=1591085 RepID=A0A2P8FWT3_9BACT|nr:hypothetical protein CLV60_110159 [Dyadobacter jiangsuensis]
MPEIFRMFGMKFFFYSLEHYLSTFMSEMLMVPQSLIKPGQI